MVTTLQQVQEVNWGPSAVSEIQENKKNSAFLKL